MCAFIQPVCGFISQNQYLRTNISEPISQAVTGLTLPIHSFPGTILPLLLPEFFPLQSPTTSVLLFGPPGTGKTMMVRALVGDLSGGSKGDFNVNFFSVSGSSVGNKYRGESEKVLRAVFSLARNHSSPGSNPSLPTLSVVLLDELDSLFGDSPGADESSLRLRTTLLTELDGVAARGGGGNEVVVVGTTNLP